MVAYTGVGFWRCRPTIDGQCETPQAVGRQPIQIPALFPYTNLTPTRGVQRHNNTMTNYLKLLVVIIISLTIGACRDKNEPNANSITGSWYGTRSYYNPAGGTKYQYLSMSFESNGTGTLRYESPVSFSVAKFVYKISGNKITCKGAYANTYGDVESDFTMDLSIEGDRLIPINKYQQFILTRDDSVMTDGDGNEIIDQSDLLHQVWISTSGETVVIFQESTFIEYELSSQFSKTYTNRSDGSYSYDPARKLINITGTQFEILLLTSKYLSLKNKNNSKIFNYNVGSESDIPVSEDELYKGTANGHNWVDLGLPSHTKWATMNIGAENENDPGDYFAWGETSGKNEFYEESYKFYSNGKYMKYLAPDSPKEAHGIATLKDEDNAAIAEWGQAWDMPTTAQIEELIKHCTVKAYGTYAIITGSNKQSIKFPLGGFKYRNEEEDVNEDAYIVSKELQYSGLLGGSPWGWYPTYLDIWCYDDGRMIKNHFHRHYGYNIRPVLKK